MNKNNNFCIFCKKNINIKEVKTDDEEYFIDVKKNPVCPECVRKLFENTYFKRVHREWEERL